MRTRHGVFQEGGGGGDVGMCSPKRHGLSAVLVKNRVLILAVFGHF